MSKLTSKAKTSTGGSKTSPTITSVPISSNLTKKFKAKQDIFKTVDTAAGPHVSSQKKSNVFFVCWEMHWVHPFTPIIQAIVVDPRAFVVRLRRLWTTEG